MVIKKIHIYGFGKWEDQTWSLNESGIHLFLGENESGKSTIMSFIEAILFGFPKKNERQYVPVTSQAYGGKVVLSIEKYGNVSVERIKGRKARGDVTVVLDDGQQTGEQFLTGLLADIDQHTFRGVFHFNLDGLAGLEKMDPAELNHYLIDTGMVGAQNLFLLEKNIEQEMSKLYKKRGRKTEMNLLAAKIEEIENEIIKWEQKIDEYEMIIKDLEQKETDQKQLENKLHSLKAEQRRLERKSELAPLAAKWEQLHLQLNEMESIGTFPEEGLELHKRYTEKRLETQSNEKQSGERLKQIEIEIEEKKLFPSLSTLKIEFNRLNKYQELYDKRQLDLDELVIERKRFIDEMEQIEKEWGHGSDEFEHFRYVPAVFQQFAAIREAWRTVNVQEEHLLQQKEAIEQQHRIVEQHLVNVNESMMDRSEYEEIKNNLNRLDSNKHLHLKLTFLNDQVSFYEQEDEELNKQRKALFPIFIGGTSLFLLITVFLSLFTNLLYTSISSIMTILFSLAMIIFIRKMNIKQKRVKKMISDKMEEKRNVEQNLNEQDRDLINKWQKVIHEEETKRKHFEKLQEDFVQIKDNQSIWEHSWEDTQTKKEQIAEELKKWCEDLHYPVDQSVEYYEGFIDAIKQWKALHANVKSLNEKIKRYNEKQKEFERDVNKLLEQIGVQNTSYVNEALKVVHEFILRESEKEKTIEKLESEKAYRRERYEKNKAERIQIEQSIDQLFNDAGVRSKDEFLEKGRYFEKKKERIEEKENIWYQMKAISTEKENFEYLLETLLKENIDYEHEKEYLEQNINTVEKKLNEAIEEKIKLQHEKNLLEQDKTYEEQLQLFSQLKEELQGYAKKWAIFAASQMLIEDVKKTYEEKRQPSVIKLAETFFQKMTGGDYKRLFAPLGREKFIVERKDGLHFEPADLSRGTCELLYLSLRLALASHVAKGLKLPLMMDETLVNIDRARRRKIISVLQLISKERQVLYFTCHDDFLKECEEKCVIGL
ncbi:ATP-binding protein [Evansella halocellulosilytica]|uniref:ATP-binding protein n=1 Tax=Evansella halocellulosilytica TaxID=2011013 RepID=UPI000BB97E2F|nr:AAA family ATPase [Evansella halocellulosilytica]